MRVHIKPHPENAKEGCKTYFFLRGVQIVLPIPPSKGPNPEELVSRGGHLKIDDLPPPPGEGAEICTPVWCSPAHILDRKWVPLYMSLPLSIFFFSLSLSLFFFLSLSLSLYLSSWFLCPPLSRKFKFVIRFAISAATYRGAKCPTLKTAKKQPKRAVFRVFRLFFRLFYRDPLGTLFGCFFGCFQCRAFGTSVGGRRDCNISSWYFSVWISFFWPRFLPPCFASFVCHRLHCIFSLVVQKGKSIPCVANWLQTDTNYFRIIYGVTDTD